MNLLAGVRAAAEAAFADNRIVGTVVAVAHRGEVVLHEAFGMADREAGRPMAPDAIFLLASATKPIASAAVLALAERGIVELEAPITHHLPDFRPRFADTTPDISLRQLLTHTSGLSYPFREPPGSDYERAGVSSGLDQPGLSGDEQLRRLASVALRFAPGTQWNYSLGVDVAGLVAAVAAGTSFDRVVAKTVTAPLGMKETDFAVRDPSRLVAHYGVDASGRPVRMDDNYAGPSLVGTPARFAPSRLFDARSYPSGGAGMAGTASDLLAFVEALRRGGAPILGAAAAGSMVTDALPPGFDDVLEPGWSYGIGTQVVTDPVLSPSPARPGAFKGSGGYGHTWFADPALEVSVVALTNAAPEGVRGQFATDIRAAVYGAFG